MATSITRPALTTTTMLMLRALNTTITIVITITITQGCRRWWVVTCWHTLQVLTTTVATTTHWCQNKVCTTMVGSTRRILRTIIIHYAPAAPLINHHHHHHGHNLARPTTRHSSWCRATTLVLRVCKLLTNKFESMLVTKTEYLCHAGYRYCWTKNAIKNVFVAVSFLLF
jgi:hypothetical protein